MSELSNGEQFLVNALAHEIGRQRMMYAGRPGNTKRTKLYEEFGYPDQLGFDQYYRAYERNPVAYAAVHKLLESCWMDKPTIIDGAENKESTETTDWEKAATKMLSKHWAKIKDADRRNLVGRYSALLIQFKDGREWKEPVDTSVVKRLRDKSIVKLIPAWESQIKPGNFDTDTMSETYGEPVNYQFNEQPVGDDGTYGPVRSVNLAKIRAETAAGVSPTQDAQGAIDPVQALANENALKLALIQEFETEKGAITANGLALINAANTEYEQARIDAAWKIWENQSQANQMLGDAIDSLQGGATNAITGLLNGTQSLAESFANIGTTILNSVVTGLVEMGLQYVKNMIMGQAAATAALASTAAQATAATAAWAPAAMSASIATLGSASAVGTTAYTTALAASKGLAIAGAREHGGPVNASSMYRVGEGGKPEIFKASNGSQYMIPGDNGSVISNRDIGSGVGSGGGLVMNFNFDIQTTGGVDEATQKQMAQMMQTVAIRTIKDQQRPSGLLSKGR